MRGGSFMDSPKKARVSYRASMHDSYRASEDGLRLVLNL